jgi:hypothetical protein
MALKANNEKQAPLSLAIFDFRLAVLAFNAE